MDDIYRSLVDPNLAIGPFVFSAGLLRIENDYSKASFPLLLMNQPIAIQDQVVIVQASNSPYEAFFRRSAYFSELSTPEARAAARLNLGLPSTDDITGLEAALTAGIAAAAASAGTATTQAGIATGAATTSGTNAADALTSKQAVDAGLATVTALAPYKARLLSGIQYPTAPLIRGSGFTATATPGVYSGTSGSYGYVVIPLSASQLAAIAAGTGITVFFELLSGGMDIVNLTQRNVASSNVVAPVAMPGVGGNFKRVNLVPVNTCTELLIEFHFSANSTFILPGVAVGEPATVPSDKKFLSLEGYKDTVENRRVPLTPGAITIGAGGTYVNGVWTITDTVNGGNLKIPLPGVVAGDFCTLRMRTDRKDCACTASKILPGNGQTFTIPPYATYADDPYVLELEFIAEDGTAPPTYQGPFGGLALSLYNPAGVVNVSEIVISKGTLPPMTETPAVVLAKIEERISARLAAGGTALSVPIPEIMLIGDSLFDTGVAGGYATKDQLSVFFAGAVPILQSAVGGATADECVARTISSWPISITGNQIPALAATQVDVTNFQTPLPITYFSSSVNGGNPLAGTYGGVPVYLIPTAGGTPTAFKLYRRTNGSAVQVRPGTPFYPDFGEQMKSRISVIRLGTNNIPGGSGGGTAAGNAVADQIDKLIQQLTPQNKQVIIGTVALGNGSGGTVVATVAAMNLALQLRFPRYYLDMSSPPSAADMAIIGFSPTSDDNADIAAGFIPRGMRDGGYSGGPGVLGGDQLHPNAYGTKFDALLIGRAARQRSYNVPA